MSTLLDYVQIGGKTIGFTQDNAYLYRQFKEISLKKNDSDSNGHSGML